MLTRYYLDSGPDFRIEPLIKLLFYFLAYFGKKAAKKKFCFINTLGRKRGGIREASSDGISILIKLQDTGCFLNLLPLLLRGLRVYV